MTHQHVFKAARCHSGIYSHRKKAATCGVMQLRFID